MYKLKLSLRYLRARPLTYLIMVQMTVGIMLLVIVPSVMTGFSQEYRKKLRSTLSDVTVESRKAFGIDEEKDGVEAGILGIEGVAATSPYLETIAIVDDPFYKDYTTVKGIDPVRELQTSEFNAYRMPYQEAIREAEDYGELCEVSSRFVSRLAQRFADEGLTDVAEALNELHAPLSLEAPATEAIGKALKRFETACRAVLHSPKGRAVLEDTTLAINVVYDYCLKKQDVDALLERLGDTPLPDQPFDASALPETLRRRAELESGDTNGSGEMLPGMVVGIQLLRVYRASGLTIGSRIKLVTASDDREVKRGDFIITGAFETGMWDVDRRFIYAPLEAVQQFVGVPGKLSGVAVKVKGTVDADLVKQRLIDWANNQGQERRLFIQTWREKHQSLLQAVKMEKLLLLLILNAFMFLVGFNILTGLTTSVFEKAKDLGILKTLGATATGLMGLFLMQGFVIGLVSTTMGLGLGVAITRNINEIADLIEALTGYHPFPADVYYLDRIPAVIEPRDLAAIIGVTLVISFLFSLWPAWKASRLDALEAMRYE